MESKHARPTVARSGWAGVWIALAALVSGCGSVASWFEPEPFEDYRRQQEARWRAEDAAKRDRAARTTEERVGFADELRGTGELDRAVWAYLEAYRRDPMNPVPLERIGFIQLTKDPPRAQITFEQLLAEQPERATAHAGMGLSYYAQGQLEPARDSLERAVELDPEAPLALSGLAAVYDLLDRPADAAEKWEQLATLRPRDPRVANNIGVSRMLQGDYPAAEVSLRRAIQLDPRDAISWNNLGLVLGNQDRYPEALDAFRKAGDEQSAQNNIGYLHYRAGRYDEAIAAYEAALLAGGDQRAHVLQNLQLALDAKDALRDASETAGHSEPDTTPPAAGD